MAGREKNGLRPAERWLQAKSLLHRVNKAGGPFKNADGCSRRCESAEIIGNEESVVRRVTTAATFLTGCWRNPEEKKEWRPYRESNPGYHRERVVS
jgi:hypothetical protein